MAVERSGRRPAPRTREIRRCYGEPQGNDHFPDGSTLSTSPGGPKPFDDRTPARLPAASPRRPRFSRPGRGADLCLARHAGHAAGPSKRPPGTSCPPDWQLRPGFESDYEQAAAWQPPAGFSAANATRVCPAGHRHAANAAGGRARGASLRPSRSATKWPPGG